MSAFFRDWCENVLWRLKQDPERGRLSVTRAGQEIAVLEPVGWPDLKRPAAVERLAAWREAGNHAFPTQFPVTLDGTRRWLEHNLLEVPDRALFWVIDPAAGPVAHLGLFRFDYAKRHCEIDNVIRGVHGVAAGVMQAAVASLAHWSFTALRLNDLYLRVFGDNTRAVRLYERCGFQEHSRAPMKKTVQGAVTSWVETAGDEAAPAERHFVTMHLGRAASAARAA